MPRSPSEALNKIGSVTDLKSGRFRCLIAASQSPQSIPLCHAIGNGLGKSILSGAGEQGQDFPVRHISKIYNGFPTSAAIPAMVIRVHVVPIFVTGGLDMQLNRVVHFFGLLQDAGANRITHGP